MPFTRRRAWLLDITFEHRETFAYACEAFARIVERGRGPKERIVLAEAFGERLRTQRLCTHCVDN